MPPYISIQKKVGETPLQALDRLRALRPELLGMPLTYAGRLDPMASGELLVLVGEECKSREKYLGLDKEYVSEVLLGYATDTGDVLGMPQIAESSRELSESDIREAVTELMGEHELPYPAFSSKTVNGKPLFKYSLEGKLGEIVIPRAHMQVHDIVCEDIRSVSSHEIIDAIIAKINLFEPDMRAGYAENDFRKSEILKAWEALRLLPESQHFLITLRMRVSSGTYVRSLANLLAERLDTIGLAYSIHRDRICM